MRNKVLIGLGTLVSLFLISILLKKTLYSDSAIVVYGNVDIRDVSLGFEVQGRVTSLRSEEGDRVTKGQVLAELDKEIFEKQLALSVAQLDQAKAVLNNSQVEYNRQKQLLMKKVSSQKNYDDAQTAFYEANGAVEVAKAKVDLDQITVKHSTLIAPDEGIIITRAKEVGSIVAQGNPIYVLALDRPVWVRTYIDERNLGKIYSGQKVRVMTDSNKEYVGHIGFISPQAEFTPNSVQTTELRTSLVYRLRVIIDNPDNGLRQGMPVTMNINLKN